MALKDALKKLNDAVTDLTSLHVQTFTGTLELAVPPEGKYDSLKEKLKKAKTDGTIDLIAESIYKFDGDSYNFITNKADDVPHNAFDVHDKAVKAGLETRQALLTMFKDIIKW